MKKNDVKPKQKDLEALQQAFLTLKSKQEVADFLNDLCTPIEIHAMSDRWFVAKELMNNSSYQEISRQNAISITTISRVSRFLKNGAGGYMLVLRKLGICK